MKLFNEFLGTLFLTASLQGILLALVLLFFRKGAVAANRVLALLTLLFSYDIFYYVYNWSQWNFRFIHLNATAEPFPYLYGPLAYIYLVLLEKGKCKAVHLLHFIPFVISVWYYSHFILLNTQAKEAFLTRLVEAKAGPTSNLLSAVIHFGKPVSLVIYALLVIKLYFGDSSQLNRHSTDPEKIKNRWLLNVTLFYLVFASAYAAYYILSLTGLLKPAYDYAIAVVMAISIYAIAYHGLKQPAIFFEIASLQKTKYAKTGLSDSFSERVKTRLLSLLELEKPYLNGNLRVQDLANMLNISSHQLSQVINREFGQVFSDFINSYRVETAKRKLADPGLEIDKILKIAFESGFNNKASFNTVFRKFTSMSPSAYRKKFLGWESRADLE